LVVGGLRNSIKREGREVRGEEKGESE